MHLEPPRISRSNDHMAATFPQQQHDESLFAEKVRRFNQADQTFRNLLDSLSEYKTAIYNVAETGVKVAQNMHAFFPNADTQHKDVAENFVRAQSQVLHKFTEDALKSFDADVLAPIKSRVDEIPAVRSIMKQRQDALVDMQRRQKKLQSERKKDGPRLRDKQRKFKDSTDRYAMFHDDVIKRFNYIERNMANFVTAPFRSLVTIVSQLMKSSIVTLDDVVKLLAEAPPITKHLAPAAPVALNDSTSGIVLERWDNDFEDDDDQLDQPDQPDDQDTDFDTDSTSARGAPSATPIAATKSGHPPRARIKSADQVPKSPHALSTLDSALNDLTINRSPRRGRSASSAPAETFSALIPSTASSQRDPNGINGGAGSSSGRGSLLGDHLNVIATSGASSTASTENLNSDRLISNTQSYFVSYQRRRLRDGKASLDTMESNESIGRDVLMRVVAMYDFSPQEANELEMHEGDVVEVTAKYDGGWWCGQNGKSAGYFPRNYTRELTTQEELDYLEEREKRKKRRGHRSQDVQDLRRHAAALSNGMLSGV